MDLTQSMVACTSQAMNREHCLTLCVSLSLECKLLWLSWYGKQVLSLAVRSFMYISLSLSLVCVCVWACVCFFGVIVFIFWDLFWAICGPFFRFLFFFECGRPFWVSLSVSLFACFFYCVCVFWVCVRVYLFFCVCVCVGVGAVSTVTGVYGTFLFF